MNPTITPTLEPVTTLFVFRQQLCTLLDLVPGNPLLWDADPMGPIAFRRTDPGPLFSYHPMLVDGRLVKPAELLSGQLRGFTGGEPPVHFDDIGPDSQAVGRFLVLYHLFGTLPGEQIVMCDDPVNKRRGLLLLANFNGEWAGLATSETWLD